MKAKRQNNLKRYCMTVLTAAALLQASAVLSAGAAGEEQITYRLKWLYNMSVAGDIYADVYQYFSRQGLSVTIKEGGPERDAIRELELGRAQFGVASADQVIRALSKNARIVVIAQLFQINPLQWMVRTDYLQIRSLQDLKDKTLGVTFGGNDEHILRTLLAKAGLTENDVTLYSVRYDFTPFLRKKVNFWPVYRNTQAVYLGEKLTQAGERYGFFNPADHGVRFVANSVITSRQMLEKRSDTVRRFTIALLDGWQAAMDPANSEATIRAVRKYDKDTSAQTLQQQLAITRSLVRPEPTVAVGLIDVDAWKQTEQILLNQLQIPAAVQIENHLNRPPAP